MKITARAYSNIAFVKYWGKKDNKLRLPSNGSISMTLDKIYTTTTVDFSKKYENDSVIIDGKTIEKEENRVIMHLNRIRKQANSELKAKVVSINNFPSSTGLSSSASGFVALTFAATKSLGLDFSNLELSNLSRQGSGSSCRSIYGGFVEWVDEKVIQLFDKNHWDLVDVVAIVSEDKKSISSTIGQTYADSSPFFKARLNYINKRIKDCKSYLKSKDFSKLGNLIEHEALDLHCIMLSSYPSLIYLTQGSLKLMKLVQEWRINGFEVYFTLNTGQNIHIICESKNLNLLLNKLNKINFIKKTIINRVGSAPELMREHLY